jgi:xanthine/CO dehydrogenase XdhC/CoxF family maturation factor
VDVFVHPVTTDAQWNVWRRVHQRLQGDQPFRSPSPPPALKPDAPGSWAKTTRRRRRLRARLHGVVRAAAAPGHLRRRRRRAALVATATGVGWRVVLVDHRPAYLSAERFPAARERFLLRPTDDLAPLRLGPETYAVVMTHSFKHDRDWARRLLEADLPYVGLLGPRQRGTILDETGAGRRDACTAPWASTSAPTGSSRWRSASWPS